MGRNALAQFGYPGRLGVSEPVAIKCGTGSLQHRTRGACGGLSYFKMADVLPLGGPPVGITQNIHGEKRLNIATRSQLAASSFRTLHHLISTRHHRKLHPHMLYRLFGDKIMPDDPIGNEQTDLVLHAMSLFGKTRVAQP